MSKVSDYKQNVLDAIEHIKPGRVEAIGTKLDGEQYIVMELPVRLRYTVLTALRAQIEPGWIKVSDRLPDWNDCRNSRVLVIFENGVIDTWNPVLIKTNLSSQLALHVTHWMQLPSAPKDGEKT